VVTAGAGQGRPGQARAGRAGRAGSDDVAHRQAGRPAGCQQQPSIANCTAQHSTARPPTLVCPLRQRQGSCRLRLRLLALCLLRHRHLAQRARQGVVLMEGRGAGSAGSCCRRRRGERGVVERNRRAGGCSSSGRGRRQRTHWG
jgi:hypothetical protein